MEDMCTDGTMWISCRNAIVRDACCQVTTPASAHSPLSPPGSPPGGLQASGAPTMNGPDSKRISPGANAREYGRDRVLILSEVCTRSELWAGRCLVERERDGAVYWTWPEGLEVER